MSKWTCPLFSNRRLRTDDLNIAYTLMQRSGWRSIVLAAGIQSHLASEAVELNLAESFIATGLAGVGGMSKDLKLVGPLHVAKSTHAAASPDWVDAYDVTFPYTIFPLDALRTRFADWGNDVRVIYMLPLLFGEEPSEAWRATLKEIRPFDSLFLFLPNPDHWEWMFTDHSREEWAVGSASALWNLKTGKVIYADGIHTPVSIRKKGVGMPLEEWLQQ